MPRPRFGGDHRGLFDGEELASATGLGHGGQGEEGGAGAERRQGRGAASTEGGAVPGAHPRDRRGRAVQPELVERDAQPELTHEARIGVVGHPTVGVAGHHRQAAVDLADDRQGGTGRTAARAGGGADEDGGGARSPRCRRR